MVGSGGRAVRIARAFLGLTGMTALAALLLACGPQTHEPGATDLATVSAIVDQLAASDDPRREFSELPSETRQAVVEYLSVEKTASAGVSSPVTPIEASNGCERLLAGYAARNAYGRDLWTYASSTEWCWADGLISTVPVFTTSVEVHAPLWEFAGHVHQHESGGQGEASHFDATEGRFQLCPANHGECVQDAEILVVKWQDGDGEYGFEIAPIEDEDPYADEVMTDETPPFVVIAYYLLVIVPVCAAAFIAGWIVRRSGARGSLAWGLGVVATAWGASVALEYFLRILIFEVLPPVTRGSLLLGLYISTLEPLPSIAAALGAGWIMWKAAQRGSATWGLGVVGIAFGTFSSLKSLVPGLIFLPAFFASPGGLVVETTVVETEEISVEEFDARAAARDKFRIEDATCERHRRGIEGRNLLGQRLWTFQSETRWCWNGYEVGKDPSISPTVSAYGYAHVPFWSDGFPGNDTSLQDAELPWELSDRATGISRLCLPLLQCVQNEFAVIEKRQFSDGTSVADYPGLTDPEQMNPTPPALTLLPVLPMSATALVAGRVLLRRSRRGSATWGFGVLATGLGVLAPVLGIIVGVFFLTVGYAAL